MGQIIQLRQARPTPEDFKIVIDFMYWLERYVTQGIEFVDNDEGDDVEQDLSQMAFIERLEEVHFNTSRGPNVYTSWERVLWGSQCAIDNAMDHSLSYLDFRPEIKAALELPAKASAETNVTTAVELLDGDGDRLSIHRAGVDP